MEVDEILRGELADVCHEGLASVAAVEESRHLTEEKGGPFPSIYERPPQQRAVLFAELALFRFWMTETRR